MNKIHTDLQVLVTILTNYDEKGVCDKKYHLQVYPSRLLYHDDLVDCNDVVKEYAFKIQQVRKLGEVCDVIKNLYTKVIEQDMRLDILFEAYDVAHNSNEYRYSSHSLIILNKDWISYNHQLPQREREEILTEMLKFRNLK